MSHSPERLRAIETVKAIRAPEDVFDLIARLQQRIAELEAITLQKWGTL